MKEPIRTLAVSLIAALTASGCGTRASTNVDFTFNRAVDDGLPREAYSLVVDRASWARLQSRRDLSQEGIARVVGGIVDTQMVKAQGCRTYQGAWHFEHITMLPDGSMRFVVTCDRGAEPAVL